MLLRTGGSFCLLLSECRVGEQGYEILDGICLPAMTGLHMYRSLIDEKIKKRRMSHHCPKPGIRTPVVREMFGGRAKRRQQWIDGAPEESATLSHHCRIFWMCQTEAPSHHVSSHYVITTGVPDWQVSGMLTFMSVSLLLQSAVLEETPS